mmetsp:Transcript_86959/g.242082  ORF Transcript_86959/g.242082 Transcript_86959/m.242082 type:complete len:310 (-) Transcript_86959:775-1704(-)
MHRHRGLGGPPHVVAWQRAEGRWRLPGRRRLPLLRVGRWDLRPVLQGGRREPAALQAEMVFRGPVQLQGAARGERHLLAAQVARPRRALLLRDLRRRGRRTRVDRSARRLASSGGRGRGARRAAEGGGERRPCSTLLGAPCVPEEGGRRRGWRAQPVRGHGPGSKAGVLLAGTVGGCQFRTARVPLRRLGKRQRVGVRRRLPLPARDLGETKDARGRHLSDLEEQLLRGGVQARQSRFALLQQEVVLRRPLHLRLGTRESPRRRVQGQSPRCARVCVIRHLRGRGCGAGGAGPSGKGDAGDGGRKYSAR